MLHLYTVNSSFGAKCIKFKGCLLWNSLPRSITNINSHVVFKKKLKYYLCELKHVAVIVLHWLYVA